MKTNLTYKISFMNQNDILLV